ncbi:MAG: hypothetical protein KVP17_003976 [Porospora cf. gigantea B]|uniref:uncharacterized protein n=1 Tax=Porospora cf. gigantea B TaxID=2853592 RepID=UPI0035717FB8|nr:MAG: hypothetical protein KVP17_003976 [Porospora cf. gigantea B]
MSKVALITGITGQDGSYLAELLLEKGYDVHGIIRRSSSFNTGRIEHVFSQLTLHYGDVIDSSNLCRLVAEIRPTEVYHLAAQSHVKVSFDMPEYTAECDAVGVLRLLEAIRSAGLQDTCRFYQASTSEMFGLVQEIPQRETTPFYPRSPYGVAKVYAHWIVKNYREAYGMFATSGILFNHESPRRGRTFVTRKITEAVAKIKNGSQTHVSLGNLDAKRDWGHAKDYVRAMWMMLQHDHADDFVVATGRQYSVRDFCDLVFACAGFKLRWEGEGMEEQGIDQATGDVLVRVDPKYFRPAEVETLLGDATKIRETLKWEPQLLILDLVHEMISNDFAKNGAAVPTKEECIERCKDIVARLG